MQNSGCNLRLSGHTLHTVAEISVIAKIRIEQRPNGKALPRNGSGSIFAQATERAKDLGKGK
jgi:hypothetical protein